MTIKLRAIQSRAVLEGQTGSAFGSALAILSVLALFALLSGCSDNPQSVQTANLAAGAGENALATAISGSELTLIQAGGVDVLDGKGVFSIGWRQLFDPRDQAA